MTKKKKLKKFRYGGGADMGAPERAASRAKSGYGGTGKGVGGRNPQAQYQGAKLSPEARKTLQSQRETAKGRISPSTTPTGKAIATGIGFLTGIPYLGGKIGERMVDYSPMAFGVPKSTKPKKTVTVDTGDRGGDTPKTAQQPIIPGPIAIDQPIMPLSQRRLATVSPTGRFGYTVGLKKGGMLRQGKPKLAKKGWK